MTASLAQVLQIAGDALDIDPQYERPMLVKRINQARNLLFTFVNGREAFAKVDGLITVACHQPGGRQTRYHAVTLPPGVLTLDKLRTLNGTNIEIFAQHSMPRQSRPPMKAVHLVGQFLFQSDPVATIYLRATDPADYGNRVGLEYTAFGVGTRREDLILACDPVGPSLVPETITTLTLPHDRQGWVIAEDETGAELASYHPKVQPGFIRYALHGVPVGTQLQWWGTREPYDVVFDTDAVEFADPSMWEELLKFAKLKRKESRTAGEQRAFMDASQFLSAQIEQALAARQGDREHLNFHNGQLERDYKRPLRYFQDIR